MLYNLQDNKLPKCVPMFPFRRSLSAKKCHFSLSAHVHILRTLDCLLWRFTILYRIKLLRDLLTHTITTQKYNKPKIIIYLGKTKETIRVLYSDNVTIVKHKYKPWYFYILFTWHIIGKIAHGQDAEEFQWRNGGGNDGWTQTSSNEPIEQITWSNDAIKYGCTQKSPNQIGQYFNATYRR